MTGSEDILHEYGLSSLKDTSGEVRTSGLKGLQKEIADLLLQEPKSIDELTRLLAIPIAAAGAELTKLCLKKTVIFVDGKYYIGAIYAD